MTVRGMSSRGTKTTDEFSLKGFTKAYAAMNQKCGIGKKKKEELAQTRIHRISSL